MKSIFILTLAAGLLAGCGAKNDKATMGTNMSSQAAAGEAFLAENAKKEGVKTTASGLQYKVLKSGTGESPKLTDTVKVHYQGTLIDGTIFDSSIQRGQPISFPVGGVIPGWVEALQMMKVGDKWQLFIPANLAYGENSPTPAIPPNSVLIFEVELLGIEK
jgi:FKBP-type peptidyl-prolyl cis-trans isomerase FklB